jgi:hypothetical protein
VNSFLVNTIIRLLISRVIKTYFKVLIKLMNLWTFSITTGKEGLLKYKWFNILNVSLFLMIDFIARKISRFRETYIFSHIKQYLTNECTLNVILFLNFKLKLID